MTILVVLGLAAGALVLPAPAGAAVPAVYAPDDTPFGKTYGAWNAQWWTTMARTVAGPGNPFADSAVKCNGVKGDDGRVILLAGTTSGTATRSCKISSTKAVLLPLVNFGCWDTPDASEEDLRFCADYFGDSVTSLNASVDGAAISGLMSYRAPSPLFTLTFVDNNVFGTGPPDTALNTPLPAVADGYYVMLKPLPRGTHTVSFGGSASNENFSFSTQATYTLTVVK